VLTRWRDEESFNAWVSSPAFAHGHRSEAERSRARLATPRGAERLSHRRSAVHSELWSYDIVDLPSLQ